MCVCVLMRKRERESEGTTVNERDREDKKAVSFLSSLRAWENLVELMKRNNLEGKFITKRLTKE